MHMNSRVRMCQAIELCGSDQHWVAWNAMPPGAQWGCGPVPPPHLSPPSYSLGSLLLLTLHFGTVCSLRAAQGLKHQFWLAHVLSRTGKKTDGSLSCTPETSQPGILQFRFGLVVWFFFSIKLKISNS